MWRIQNLLSSPSSEQCKDAAQTQQVLFWPVEGSSPEPRDRKQASRDYSPRTFGLKEADQFSDDRYRVYLWCCAVGFSRLKGARLKSWKATCSHSNKWCLKHNAFRVLAGANALNTSVPGGRNKNMCQACQSSDWNVSIWNKSGANSFVLMLFSVSRVLKAVPNLHFYCIKIKLMHTQTLIL